MPKNELATRSKILELETTLLNDVDNENVIQNGGEIVRSDKFPLKHSFADGIYIRQMEMRKDSIVVGAIHNHLHVWFLLTGNITVATEGSTEEYLSPCYVVCTPGVKRVIYANEESIFVNIHKNPSNTQDLDELEAEIVSRNYNEYEQYTNKNK
jgi:quercetin dioxygenase-like cupin family protein